MLGESRGRVLAVLADAGRALGVAAVADAVGLHVNTARFHLDALVQAGVVERTSEDRRQPGRPRMLYAARPEAGRAGQRNYRLLAGILAGYLAAETPRPAQAAVKAGRAWGRYLAERPPPFRRVSTDLAVGQLVDVLDGIGFAPEAVRSRRSRQILLHHCPFREIAQEHREVVCSVHLGLMQGVLAAVDAPIDTERLDPFVEPDLCVAQLTESRAASAGGTTPRGRA